MFIPAEDGGYVLIGRRRPQPGLFEGIDWWGYRAGDGADATAAFRAALHRAKLPPSGILTGRAIWRAWPPWKDLPHCANEHQASPHRWSSIS